METEYRFLFYTHEAILLALGQFPFYIVDWEFQSQKQQAVTILNTDNASAISSHIIHRIKSVPSPKERIVSITEKLFAMPPQFSYKIGKLFCLEDQEQKLFFLRKTLHPRLMAEKGHKEVIHNIQKVWNLGFKYFEDLIHENPYAKDFIPKIRSLSILQLEAVDGDPNKAQDLKILWDIYDQVIQTGNIYAQTPICAVVERKLVKKNFWEYTALSGEVVS